MFMEKTTLYLPDDLKSAIKKAAAQQGVSEAEIIRQAIRQVVSDVRPRPRGSLFSSGHPIARRADELLAGFGER
jgi:metal-responsive CopG/Arc/MetJ family transcriptional regulator